ncbi:MAG: tetratricopeptide repeat protein, partial [Planctomycetales bacterium]|nr:tetratricopeptide repeat protein [Planctomycetales bacterium]
MSALDAGDEQHASQLFQQAITACPTDASARRQYAELLWRQGDDSGARSQIEQAITHDQTNPELHLRAGEMLLELGNL